MTRQVHKTVKQLGEETSVQVSSGVHGVKLGVKGALLFDPGRAQAKNQARPLLSSVVKVMARSSFYLTIVGHTDNCPIHIFRFPSKWELSAARAAPVLRFLVGQGVSEGQVNAVGYASNYSLAANDTRRTQ